MEHPTFLYCEDCKKIATVIEGSPTLACCGDPMKALRANTSDGAAEKHVPVVKKQGSTVEVCVGDVPHPMSREHSIGWVCLVTKEGWQLKKLPSTATRSQSSPSPKATRPRRPTPGATCTACGRPTSIKSAR